MMGRKPKCKIASAYESLLFEASALNAEVAHKLKAFHDGRENIYTIADVQTLAALIESLRAAAGTLTAEDEAEAA